MPDWLSWAAAIACLVPGFRGFRRIDAGWDRALRHYQLGATDTQKHLRDKDKLPRIVIIGVSYNHGGAPRYALRATAPALAQGNEDPVERNHFASYQTTDAGAS